MRRHLRQTVALLLAVLMFVTACSRGPSPTAIATAFLAAVQKTDQEAMDQLRSSKTDSTSLSKLEEGFTETVFKAFMAKMTYRMGESHVKGNEAVVHAEITLPDIERIAAGLMGELVTLAFAAASDSKLNMDLIISEKMVTAINDPDAPTRTANVKIHLQREDRNWKVVAIDELNLGNSLLKP